MTELAQIGIAYAILSILGAVVLQGAARAIARFTPSYFVALRTTAALLLSAVVFTFFAGFLISLSFPLADTAGGIALVVIFYLFYLALGSMSYGLTLDAPDRAEFRFGHAVLIHLVVMASITVLGGALALLFGFL